ncbi:hypothetical protein BUALT_Bualt07G0139400 [Buddleja alternifolia]|uniref:Retrovirus-related Pol polyprotein from transposon RE1 n=1 Tax=Buddleja alternifolia TaxID=168488 RepID=A0AAV6XAL7_9LAMI|nr:hypothetical protein BUALT_Bualt07G0139400 [Buddleja alternifolia]
MTDLDDLHSFLTVEVLKTSSGLFFSQQKYIRELLKKIGCCSANLSGLLLQLNLIGILLQANRVLEDWSRWNHTSLLLGYMTAMVYLKPPAVFLTNSFSIYCEFLEKGEAFLKIQSGMLLPLLRGNVWTLYCQLKLLNHLVWLGLSMKKLYALQISGTLERAGQRRNVHDDITILVVFVNPDLSSPPQVSVRGFFNAEGLI